MHSKAVTVLHMQNATETTEEMVRIIIHGGGHTNITRKPDFMKGKMKINKCIQNKITFD